MNVGNTVTNNSSGANRTNYEDLRELYKEALLYAGLLN